MPRDEAASSIRRKVTGFGLAWDQGVGNCRLLANVNFTYFDRCTRASQLTIRVKVYSIFSNITSTAHCPPFDAPFPRFWKPAKPAKHSPFSNGPLSLSAVFYRPSLYVALYWPGKSSRGTAEGTTSNPCNQKWKSNLKINSFPFCWKVLENIQKQ